MTYETVADIIADRDRLRQENESLRAAVAWALGEAESPPFSPDDDEPRRPDGQPVARYWWRGTLRRLARKAPHTKE